MPSIRRHWAGLGDVVEEDTRVLHQPGAQGTGHPQRQWQAMWSRGHMKG